jgi:outer membrane lipoprotein SlyB
MLECPRIRDMTKILPHLIWIVSLAAVSTGEAQRVGQGTTIQFGIVRNAQQVPLQSDAAAGALVGGTLGLVAGSRRPARNALIGAAAGGAVTAAAQGNRTGFAYTVELNDGSMIRIVSNQREIRPGDCVAVEQVGQTSNIRREPAGFCARNYAQAVQAVQPVTEAAAARCEAAKEELVMAGTPEAIDLASRKIDLLCN